MCAVPRRGILFSDRLVELFFAFYYLFRMQINHAFGNNRSLTSGSFEIEDMQFELI